MQVINEPIEFHNIIITELVIPDNMADPIYVINTFQFKTLTELKEYLFKPSKFSVARSLGYNIRNTPDLAMFNQKLKGRIAFEYSDRIIKKRKFEFLSVEYFIRFLRENPSLGGIVGLP